MTTEAPEIYVGDLRSPNEVLNGVSTIDVPVAALEFDFDNFIAGEIRSRISNIAIQNKSMLRGLVFLSSDSNQPNTRVVHHYGLRNRPGSPDWMRTARLLDEACFEAPAGIRFANLVEVDASSFGDVLLWTASNPTSFAFFSEASSPSVAWTLRSVFSVCFGDAWWTAYTVPWFRLAEWMTSHQHLLLRLSRNESPRSARFDVFGKPSEIDELRRRLKAQKLN